MINAGKPSAYRKDVSLQLIACYNAPPVRLPVGSRVISRYVNWLKNTVKFFSGMIAEMPSHINNFRLVSQNSISISMELFAICLKYFSY